MLFLVRALLVSPSRLFSTQSPHSYFYLPSSPINCLSTPRMSPFARKPRATGSDAMRVLDCKQFGARYWNSEKSGVSLW